ncbi:MAG TPA: glycosyl hydrolase [Verrucomicrobia bacterium]|nr:glycosyl hydrolase [Verrucomicrobiota bacterium]HOP97142.1 glycoside hydrolase family 88 protein [Verrucomicrobiota bacterium]HPU56371.1 glycoside hydrolase family 88 protein [Verrucomicrobiota bacterium]
MQTTFRFIRLSGIALLAAAVAGCAATRRPAVFSDWPPGASPEEVGKRVSENFVARQLDFQTNPRRQYVIYPEVCTWLGALRVAKLTGDDDLKKRLIDKFDPLMTAQPPRISPADHVDYRVFGAVPLEIYMQTKDPKYLELGKGLADKQWEKPTPDGITHEARYWVDDIYMISAVQVQAYRATGDRVYLDRAALTAAAYLDKLQQPNGLFLHAEDSPFFWARGNGWYAAGMAELLSELPRSHPRYDRIMQGYRTMMESLLKYQSEEGLWRQLVDKSESWPETSGTGMFTYAMVTGIKHGWLDEATYGPAARKAWLALVSRLDQNANVRDVCVGTDKAFQRVGADLSDQLRYYLDRPRSVGDLHGQAPILWTAAALLQ